MIPNQRRPQKRQLIERSSFPPCGTAASDPDEDAARLLSARQLIDPVVLVGLEGAVDVPAVLGLCRQLCCLRWQACTLVVLDTSAVTGVDPAGMAAVQALAEALARAGHRLLLWATPEVLLRAMEDAGLDEHLMPLAPRTTQGGPDQLEALEAGARLAVADADVPADAPAAPPAAAPTEPPDGASGADTGAGGCT